MKIEFTAVPVTLDASAPDGEPARTITGIAVPWDTTATVSSGETIKFERGAFDLSAKAPKLLEGHDMNALRGIVSELADSEDGLLFTAKFANTAAANDAIELVKAGAYDSVSVGAVPTKYRYDKNGTMVVSSADLLEISLVAMPAFADARITEIAASSPEEDDETQPTPDDSEEISTMSDNNETPVVEAAAVVPTTPIHAQPVRSFRMPTASEYIAKFVRGGAEFAEFTAKIRAAAPDVTTTETPGLLPEPIVSPVYNSLIGRRNVIDAVGTRGMPQGGKVFSRPVVTTHTSIGPSNGENAALDAGTFVVDSVPVTKGVYGGYVQLSEEDLDWSSPEVLASLLDDMGRVYASQTEAAVETALESGITALEPIADDTSPADWAAFVWNASKTILDATTHLPGHLFLSPSYWAALGQLVDDAGRPLFPQVGPMNAYGNMAPGTLAGNAFGLQVVITPHLEDFAAVGNADGFEIYEQQKGAISVEAADGSISRFIKWRGYLATLMIDADKFVKQGTPS